MKVVVREARGYPVQNYPLEVVAVHQGKDVSQANLIRTKRDGLIFGNGMITAIMMQDRITRVEIEDHNVVFDPDCEGIE